MDSVKEYPNLTALMQGREPGSVKVRQPGWDDGDWFRPGARRLNHTWVGMDQAGQSAISPDETADDGPWLIVSEDAPALANVEYASVIATDTLRLEIASMVLAALHSTDSHLTKGRYAYALAEADALIEEARK